MKFGLDNWPYKWYGVWKEQRLDHMNRPSALDYVDKSRNSSYDVPRLIKYLSNATVVASSSRINFASPFSKEFVSGSISYRTDGEWVWLDDLSTYIEKNDLAIPDAWYREIERRNFIPPQVSECQMQRLQWPSP